MRVFHFCMNILFLLYIARPLERFYGSARFFVVYILLAIMSGVIIHFLYTGSYPLAGLMTIFDKKQIENPFIEGAKKAANADC